MLSNLQNVSDFDNPWVRKISTSKNLGVRIIQVCQKHLERIYYWSHWFAGGKKFTSKTLQVDWNL